MRALMVALLALLVAAPAAEALDIGARSLQARPSDEYSPETAWDAGFYGCGVTIAVFDEGIDDRHPLLDGKVAAGVALTNNAAAQEAINPGNPQPLGGTHGTPVAGLAGSHGGQFFSSPEAAPSWADDALVGVAPCAWLVDVMFNDPPPQTGLVGVNPMPDNIVANMVAAFDWAIENRDNDWGDADASNDGIDIITVSWSPLDGTDGADELSQAANRAVAAGIVVLGSMGNSGPDYEDWGTPAAADLTLGIGALYDERTVKRGDDHIVDYSTPGPRPTDGDDDPYDEMKPDVAAPAHGIVGPGPSRLDGREYGYACFADPSGLVLSSSGAQCEVVFGGTSAATPMMAGVVALMLQANPGLTPADVKEILHQTAEPHPDQEPEFPLLNARYNRTYGWGMANAYAAVVLAQQWPGMELGRDRDSDGVRDVLDAAPTDPSNRTLRGAGAVVQQTVSPTAGPTKGPTADAAAGQELGAVPGRAGATSGPSSAAPAADGKDSPGAGPLAVAGLLAAVALALRPRRGQA
jgi:subtilisin family serine protease